MNDREREALVQLVADMEIRQQHDHEREAIGWVIVTVCDEYQSIPLALGTYPTAEAALIAAQACYAQDARLAEPGEKGWTHLVVPLYPPGHGPSA